MKIKRAIAIIFLLRAAMLGLGCGRTADLGENCQADDGACSDLDEHCADGLYCDHPNGGGDYNPNGTCQACTTPDCEGATTPAPISTTAPSSDCSLVIDAAACGIADEQLLQCAPYSNPTVDELGGRSCYALDPSGRTGEFCCMAQTCNDCDAGQDASDSSDDADAGDVDADN